MKIVKSASHYTETAVDEMKLLQMVCTHFGKYLAVLTISSCILLNSNRHFYVHGVVELPKRIMFLRGSWIKNLLRVELGSRILSCIEECLLEGHSVDYRHEK